MKSLKNMGLLQMTVNVSTLAVLGLVVWFVHESREMSGHQKFAQAYSQNSIALGQLLEEAAQYSRRDPSIVPLLNQIVGRASGPAPTTQASPNPVNASPTRH